MDSALVKGILIVLSSVLILSFYLIPVNISGTSYPKIRSQRIFKRNFPKIFKDPEPEETTNFISIIDYDARIFEYNSNFTSLEYSLDSQNISDHPLCPDLSYKLQMEGTYPVKLDPPIPDIEDLEKNLSWVNPGGHWSPSTCRAPDKLAIIIPYRQRGMHLLLLLKYLHQFLKIQLLDYTLFVVEQDGDGIFNKGVLFNAGFLEALKIKKFDCFIFHDVDLIPENYGNIYSCPQQPRHMSVAINKYKYRLPYPGLFGGVTAMKTEHFKLVNGYSNLFYGWGGEDDDMTNRIRHCNLYVSRYPLTIARYKMVKHTHSSSLWITNLARFKILKRTDRFQSDGLNSVRYIAEKRTFLRLYTWLLIKVPPRPK